MQHLIVALGINKKSQIEYAGTLEFVATCLRVSAALSFYRSAFLIIERFRHPPEYTSLFLRQSKTQHGWQYGN